MADPISGTILHLQRFSTEDGPGIRTTVFFKGCPLSCLWCHNPESLSLKPQVQWLAARCIGCRSCIPACPTRALSSTTAGITIDRAQCTGCGACVDSCPTEALERLGSPITAADLTAELLKDRTYFETSAGGVTLSGGEPALQPAFAVELLQRLHAAGVQTALDTCGLTSQTVLSELLPRVDLVLYDLKAIDSAQHRALTGQPNERILENLLFIRDNPPPRLWIRTPLIPGATLNRENLAGIGNFLAENLGDRVERWELCNFNNLCRDKYLRLGMKWAFADTPLLTAEETNVAVNWARLGGLAPERIRATGATRN